MSRSKAVSDGLNGTTKLETSKETNVVTPETKPSKELQTLSQTSGEDCSHEKTMVQNYNKKTLLGELWCHICGSHVGEYDHGKA